ncbi:uncharacterized protein N7483_000574 [Penicillium malachiteum]|uniref:uncharacterized protein n=1 Tax=Penicillium malachiteum TaxID=1324776 RepID=UPI0025472BE2|nr:uncharacterized protein N7483_000574 [Penicillium malachiteum]KAJ5735449.1 hypothetical protein N7483_000574 [Penicillium malachiteum]
MCLYKGVWYYECQHVRFHLSTFCQDLLEQLCRMSDTITAETESPTTVENPQSCLPRLLARDGILDMQDKGQENGAATNISEWVIDLADLCPSCSLKRDS